MKPFLKWAGGKQKLVSSIEALLPASRRLIEPFVGGGSVFCGVERQSYLLGDANVDLIALYRHLQRGGDRFINDCRRLFTAANLPAAVFYDLRAQFNALEVGDVERAALFVYINRFGFNGLSRYNAKGGLNTSHGKPTSVPYFPEAEMLAFAAKAKRATFVHQGFADTMSLARPGDVVYCDPPYVGTWTGYAAGGFTQDDQVALAAACWDCADRGVTVVVSNSDAARALYKGADLHELSVRRSISCDGKRGRAAEIMAVFPGQAALRRAA